MTYVPPSPWIRYGAAVLVTAAALALKLLLVPLVTQDAPFLVFFAAVMAAASFGGLGAGTLVVALAAIVDNYFFMEPYGTLVLSSEQVFRLMLFVGEGIFISVVCARLAAARHHAEQSAAEARELERRILETGEAEQRRIGHDLHDGLGQHLTGIAMLTRRLHNHLCAAASPESEDAAKISSLAQTAVQWTHDLCRTLSPVALESSGLIEALRELAANAESLFGIECAFDLCGNAGDVDLSAADHLYRIAQEAISNAVRHGRAKHVRINLDARGPRIVVEISDDGSGIGPAKHSADGMGLRIMRYRARMIGASIDVRRRGEAGGTVVTCRYSPAADREAQIDHAH